MSKESAGSDGRRDALTTALDAVSDRWSLHVIRALALGARRYTEIHRLLGIPRDVLSARLKALQEQGIVRHAADAIPPQPGYELTRKGHDLGQVILVLKRWGDTYSPADTPRRTLIHRQCGREFRAEVRCEACGREVRDGDIQAEPATDYTP